MTDLINASILELVEKNMKPSEHSVNMTTIILFWDNLWHTSVCAKGTHC